MNFELAESIKGVFDGELALNRIIEYLSVFHGKKIEKQDTFVIFEEVQECPRALTALKYFAENEKEYASCCAGSRLGMTLHEGTTFPIGKVDFLRISPPVIQRIPACHPVLEENFMERKPDFLTEKLSDYLQEVFHHRRNAQGRPNWVDGKDFSSVSGIQGEILESYRNDFSKHAPRSIVPKIHHVQDSILGQLTKANKKFVYGLAKKGAREREYEDALLWLRDSGMIRRVPLVAGGMLLLKAYKDLKLFKIYHLDTGVFRSMCGIDPSIIMEKARLFSEFNGSLTEQFVLQELCSQKAPKDIYYWSEGGNE